MIGSIGKILVTGAAGTHGGTGGYVVEALRRRAVPVRAMVRCDDSRAAHLRAMGVETVVGDFQKLGTLRRALDGIDGVFFCYPLASGLLQATTNVCVAAKEAGVRAIANVSLMLAAADQPSPVCRDHWLSERIFDWAEVGAIHLRGGFFFENLLLFARNDIRHDHTIPLPFGDGTSKIAWVSSHDVATVAATILAHPAGHTGQTYEVTSSTTMSINDIAESMTATLGERISYLPMPLDAWLQHVAPVLANNEQLRAHVSMLGRAFASRRVAGRTNDLVRQLTGDAPWGVAEFAEAHAAEFAADKSVNIRPDTVDHG
jgi:NAD(P)H dehydrogenase (quinone)